MTRIRNMILSFVSLLILTVTGCNSEYDQGYRQGVQDVRDVRHHLGGAGELGLHMQNFFGVEERPDRPPALRAAGRESQAAELPDPRQPPAGSPRPGAAGRRPDQLYAGEDRRGRVSRALGPIPHNFVRDGFSSKPSRFPFSRRQSINESASIPFAS